MGTRQLAAILFTDAVGYSAAMHDNESLAASMIASDGLVIRTVCENHGGSVVKSTGDGFLIIFASAVQAVQCALELQSDFQSRSALGTSFQHRFGLHLGDVIAQNNDVIGDGVNIAARLQTAAQPGGILASQAVFDAVKGTVSEWFGPPITLSLRNISDPITAYGVGDLRTYPTEPQSSRVLGSKSVFIVAATIASVGVILGGIAAFRPGQPPSSDLVAHFQSPPKPQSPPFVEPQPESKLPDEQSAPPKTPESRETPASTDDGGEVVNQRDDSAQPSKEVTDHPVDPQVTSKFDSAGDSPKSVKGQMRKSRDELHKSYDFLGLVKLAEESGQAESRVGMARTKVYRELADLMTWLDQELLTYSPSRPLSVNPGREGNQGQTLVWTEDSELVVQTGENRRFTKLRECPPRFVHWLGTKLLETSRDSSEKPKKLKVQTRLRLFAKEYGLDTKPASSQLVPKRNSGLRSSEP